MVDNPRDWQPPFEDDEEFWRRFEESLEAQEDPQSADSQSNRSEEWEGRFIPPEPPAITAPPDAIARAAWIAVIAGPILAIVGYVFAVSAVVGGVGIGAAIAGFVILVARRDRHQPPGEDHGDGAVV